MSRSSISTTSCAKSCARSSRSCSRSGRTTVVYATTEPQEALQLGGHTALLAEGRVLQSGPTLEVFRRPATLEAARAFSDPPLNEFVRVRPAHASRLTDDCDCRCRAACTPAISEIVMLGIRAHEFSLAGATGQLALRGRVELAEISGSETYIHLARDDVSLVAQIPGVHDLPLGEPCTLYVDPRACTASIAAGSLLFAPET